MRVEVRGARRVMVEVEGRRVPGLEAEVRVAGVEASRELFEAVAEELVEWFAEYVYSSRRLRELVAREARRLDSERRRWWPRLARRAFEGEVVGVRGEWVRVETADALSPRELAAMAESEAFSYVVGVIAERVMERIKRALEP